MQPRIIGEGITFDDVLLVPARSNVVPREADVRTSLTRNITLNIPLVSSPMDTVTESGLAIALAQEGGIGIIHKNLDVEAQCREVAKVKRSANGVIDKNSQFPNSCRDARGRLRVGAAVGVFEPQRVEALIQADVDVIVVDSAHGHSENVLQTVKEIRRDYDIDLIAGNVATAEGARDLIDAGADAIKVGIGPGSICTTRVVSGVGIPQMTAIFNVVEVADAAGVPVIADGGIRYSGDLTKAIAAGANAAMLGSLFAGLDESPGTLVSWKGRRFKEYRGMGSIGAMHAGSADRYGQADGAGKMVPEGVEGRVPYRGSLAELTYQLIGGLRAGMGYCGTPTIAALRRDAKFVRISGAGMLESHPHNLMITEEAPNYAVENPIET